MKDNEIKQLWKNWYPKIYGYYFRRVSQKEDVEDLTSVALTKYITTIQYNPTRTFSNAYVWRMCHNMLINYFRDGSKQPVAIIDDEEWEPTDLGIEKHRSQWYQQKVNEVVSCAKKAVNSEQFEIITMSIYDDMTSHEIAEKLGMKSGTVRQILSRGLQKIKQLCIRLWQTH